MTDLLAKQQRQHGYDHNHLNWSQVHERGAQPWAHGKPLTVFINVCLASYPLEQPKLPVAIPHGLSMPYPDLRHYTLRQYGLRVGIVRFLKALSERELPFSVALQSDLIETHPRLIERIRQVGAEVIAHGANMTAMHFEGLEPEVERLQIAASKQLLVDAGFEPKGWLSPGRQQSHATLGLLAESGFDYCLDWASDDLPFAFNHGDLYSLPLTQELDDQYVIGTLLHRDESWAEQVNDALDMLAHEGNRAIGLNLNPWLTGQPHRIGFVEGILDRLVQDERIEVVMPSALLSFYRQAYG